MGFRPFPALSRPVRLPSLLLGRIPGGMLVPSPRWVCGPTGGMEPVRKGQWVDPDLWFGRKDPPRAVTKEPHEKVPQMYRC